ncbi:GNAT family N-acetyltransferase [Sphingobacterium anhuiense]|uniref:GNAT family N-acetyltransferase n=1 Tax=Sphingobacterium anhuiense TaxID=493780 RepID=UPI003C2BE572
MKNTALKKVTLQDVETLQKIGRATFAETFSDGSKNESLIKYLEEAFSIKKLTQELNVISSQFYFAVRLNEVIGYMKLNKGSSQTELQDEQALEIERIYLLRAYHGKKIGQLLCEQAIAVAQNIGSYYVWLGVWTENKRAIRIYEKNGFLEFDSHIFKLGNDEHINIMMKRNLKQD